MGAGPSRTRKLSVENDDPTNVIRVSEDVVDRIRGGQMVRQPQVPAASVPQAGFPFYLGEPSLTSIQLRQENIENLKENDAYWTKRLDRLEACHQKINAVLEEEYEKATKELGQSETTKKILNELPCEEQKNKVLKCYKENCNEPMKCSDLVKEFQECVDKKRICLVAKSKQRG